MRIAIDIRAAGGAKAGKGWYTFNLVQELLKLDKENEYILYAKDGIAGFQQYKNATLKLIDKRGYFWHRAVAKDIVKEECEVFFAPSSYIIPAILPKFIKTIVTVHDLVVYLFPLSHNKKAVFLERIFLRRAVKRAAHILTVSQNTKHDLLEKFTIDRDKLDTVYCAASSEFQPVPKSELQDFVTETHLPEKFFLAVGTLEPRKNYLNLIKAFAQLSQKFPNYHLVIVGQPGWGYEAVYQEIKDSYLGKKVHLLGYLSNRSLGNLYNLATALVFPSLYEGFGMPVLEAMQSGCPVIASNNSSIPEVVEGNALLIDPTSHLDIAGAMIKLASDPNLGLVLRQKGLHQAKKFSWQNSADKLLEVIKSLTD
ncbi:MAG: glycosyltransferase family 1 protein [Patescibacteria group bacterium]